MVDAPVSRQLHMDIPNPSDNEKASLRVGETLMRDSQQGNIDRLISAEVWTLSVDRLTGVVEGRRCSVISWLVRSVRSRLMAIG